MSRIALLGFAALLAACSATTATPSATLTPSAPTQPIVVTVLTDTPAPTDTAAPATPTPTPTPPDSDTPTPASPSPSPTPSPGPCANDADFVADLTVPDGTQFQPGQPINKQWSVRNSGGCDWDAGYRLVLVSGNALGARSEHMLYPARAGAQAVIEINMAAPAEPGSYTGRWQARDPEGNLFGDRIFITIQVIAPPTEEPPAESTPEP